MQAYPSYFFPSLLFKRVVNLVEGAQEVYFSVLVLLAILETILVALLVPVIQNLRDLEIKNILAQLLVWSIISYFLVELSAVFFSLTIQISFSKVWILACCIRVFLIQAIILNVFFLVFIFIFIIVCLKIILVLMFFSQVRLLLCFSSIVIVVFDVVLMADLSIIDDLLDLLASLAARIPVANREVMRPVVRELLLIILVLVMDLPLVQLVFIDTVRVIVVLVVANLRLRRHIVSILVVLRLHYGLVVDVFEVFVLHQLVFLLRAIFLVLAFVHEVFARDLLAVCVILLLVHLDVLVVQSHFEVLVTLFKLYLLQVDIFSLLLLVVGQLILLELELAVVVEKVFLVVHEMAVATWVLEVFGRIVEGVEMRASGQGAWLGLGC